MRDLPKILFLSIIIFFSIRQTFAKPLFVLAIDSGLDAKPWPIFLANIQNVKPDKIQLLHLQPESVIKPMPLQLKTGLQPETEVLSVVFAGTPKQKEPAFAFKGFREFIEKNKDRPKVIYALASQGMQKNASLYQLDAKTGLELSASPLPYPIEAGSLILEDVYFGHDWHRVLLIDCKKVISVSSLSTLPNAANARNLPKTSTSTELLVFDISNPKQIQPLSIQANTSSFMAISKPKIICTEEGQWGILRGGKIAEEGILSFIPFQFPMQESFIPISGTQGLAVLIPVDLDFTGAVQQVYAIDEGGGFWKIDFKAQNPIIDSINKNNKNSVQVSKMPQIPPFMFSKNICLLKSPNGKEIDCLGLQKKTGEQKKNLEENANIRETLMINQQALAEGAYLDFYFCAGNLILIPRNEDQKPELFARTGKGYKKIACDWTNDWTNQRSMTQLGTKTAHSIRVQTACICDSRKRQLKIISLNDEGLLSLLDWMPLRDSAESAKRSDGSDRSTGFDSLRAKRVAWRKNNT